MTHAEICTSAVTLAAHLAAPAGPVPMPPDGAITAAMMLGLAGEAGDLEEIASRAMELAGLYDDEDHPVRVVAERLSIEAEAALAYP